MNFEIGELYLYEGSDYGTNLLQVLGLSPGPDDEERAYVFKIFEIPAPPNTITLSDSSVTRLQDMGGKFTKLKGRAKKLAIAKCLLKQ